MKIQGHLPLLLLQAGVTLVLLAASAAFATPPPKVKIVESQRRNDLTAGGSFQRNGLLRQQQRVQRILEKQPKAVESKKK